MTVKTFSTTRTWNCIVFNDVEGTGTIDYTTTLTVKSYPDHHDTCKHCKEPYKETPYQHHPYCQKCFKLYLDALESEAKTNRTLRYRYWHQLLYNKLIFLSIVIYRYLSSKYNKERGPP